MKGLFFIVVGFFSTAIHVSAQVDSAQWNEKIDSAYISAERRQSFQYVPITTGQIKMVISPLGESDPVKYIQTLPGVSSGMEGGSSYYVRGGNSGGNSVSLDGVHIYGAGHILGLTNVYSPAIIGTSEFYSGGFCSEDSGFTSSHLKLTSSAADYRNTKTGISVSNFMLGASVNAPVKKDSLCLTAALRVSPIGLEYNLFRPLLSSSLSIPQTINAGVGDAYLKLSYLAKDSSVWTASVFGSIDSYSFAGDASTRDKMSWSNIIARIGWDKKLDLGWNLKSFLSFNQFQTSQNQTRSAGEQDPVNDMQLTSGIREIMLKATATKMFRSMLNIQYGAEIGYAFFYPGFSRYVTDQSVSVMNSRSFSTIKSTIHGQIDYKLGGLNTRLATRCNLFLSDRKLFFRPELSLFMSYPIADCFSIQATYDHTTQFYHVLEGLPTGWSMDMIVPSTRRNAPEMADQFYAGMGFDKWDIELNIGGFYKKMKNLVFFANATDFFTSSWSSWDSNMESGDGSSYGFEFFVSKKGKFFNAQASYTWSKTDRLFENLNKGASFPFKFDRTHIVNLMADFLIFKTAKTRQKINLGISYSSGHYETVTSGSYTMFFPGPDKYRDQVIVSYTSHPNNLKLPDYFRMDIAYHLELTSDRFEHDFSFGIYNLTNRHNPYSLFWDKTQSKWKQLSIFPIMPNFSYKLSF